MKYLESSDHALKAILENFVDGVLLLTEQQDIVYANATAHALYAELNDKSDTLPYAIRQVCQALVDSHKQNSEQPVMLESEVVVNDTTFRLRAQWLELEMSPRPYLLLRLQDQTQSLQGLAIAEAQKWGLTPRETEVWLRRRSGYSRKAIAAHLYIALDTVKKHLKNITVKQQITTDEEWRSHQAS